MKDKTNMPTRPQPEEDDKDDEVKEGGCLEAVFNFFKELKHKLFDA